MPHATDTLSAVLQVLDHAEAQQAQEKGLERERLVALTQSMGSTHPTEALLIAADAVIEGRALACPATPAPMGRLSGFGWKRPVTEHDRQVRLAKRQRLARWRPSLQQLQGGWWALCGTTVIAAFHAFVMALAGPKMMQDLLAHPWLSWFMALLVGIPMTALLSLTLGDALMERIHAWKALAELEEADLTQDLKDYLDHAGCRAYLRAVLASGVPRLLGKDVVCLDELRLKGKLAVLEAQWKEETLQAQAAARQREQEQIAQRPMVLAQIAAALNHAED